MKQSAKQKAAKKGQMQPKDQGQQKTEFSAKQLFLIPLLLALFCVPLIVREHVYDAGLQNYPWYPDRYEELDLFHYWKGVVLVILAAVMLVCFAVLSVRALVNRKNRAERTFSIRQDYWLFLLFGFALLQLLSTLLSPYREAGFQGAYDSFQTIQVRLAYCVVLFYAYYIVRNDSDLRFVRGVLFALFAVIGLLGSFQALGLDFFDSTFARNFMFSDEHTSWRETMNLHSRLLSVNKTYLAQGHSNHAAHFLSMIVPLSACMIFAYKKVLNRVLWSVVTVLLFVSALGTGNRTLLLILIFVMLLGACFFRSGLRKHLAVALTVFAIVIVGVGACYWNVERVKDESPVFGEQNTLDEVTMEADHVRFVYNGTPLLVSFTEDETVGLQYTFLDENGTVLESYLNENALVRLRDERFDGLLFMQYRANGDTEHPFYGAALVPDDDSFLTNSTARLDVSFLFKRTDSGYVFIAPTGKPAELVETPSAFPSALNRIASRRGYIWSKSIPLIKDHLLLGAGAESFIYVYPNNDYLGRFNTDNTTTIITRPHNLYLQTAIQYGVVALVLFLGVLLIYLFCSFRLYWHADLQNTRQVFGIGLMLGVVGYAAVAMLTDSVASVAPLFWILLGIGFAVNRMNRAEKQAAK